MPDWQEYNASIVMVKIDVPKTALCRSLLLQAPAVITYTCQGMLRLLLLHSAISQILQSFFRLLGNPQKYIHIAGLSLISMFALDWQG